MEEKEDLELGIKSLRNPCARETSGISRLKGLFELGKDF